MWYQIWYKKIGTQPIMPSAVVAKSEEEKVEIINGCKEKGLEVVCICELPEQQ